MDGARLRDGPRDAYDCIWIARVVALRMGCMWIVRGMRLTACALPMVSAGCI